jgi:hypothetical protein
VTDAQRKAARTIVEACRGSKHEHSAPVTALRLALDEIDLLNDLSAVVVMRIVRLELEKAGVDPASQPTSAITSLCRAALTDALERAQALATFRASPPHKAEN